MAAPFFFVKKKDGALRPVQDYRRLNDMTIKNRYPFPLVSELIEYLGVIIAHGTVHMDPKKVEAVAFWPTPRNKKNVQQFLGFVNFYRRFVKNFACLATPLNRLCSSLPWTWTSTENDAFLALQKAATEGPVLNLPIDDAPFRIEADSSGYATGAVLSQLQDNHWRPIAYYSKTLNDVERNGHR
jgi:hypothetical protein